MKPKVAILFRKAQEHVEMLQSLAPSDLEVISVDNLLPDDEKIPLCRDMDAFILLPSDLSVNLARACPRLKLVQTLSAGYNRLDLKALGELGIPIANNGGSNAIAVAEQAIGLMLMVSRKMALSWYSAAKERKWRRGLSAVALHEITGKTVGIVGLGRIGKRVAKRLQGFDCKVLYHDILTFPPELEQELNVERVSFEQILLMSDIVTLHVPLTPLTSKMIGKRELEMMKPSAILINTSRGPVVDEKALYEALKSGRIAGAGLDVVEQEPTPPDNPILDLDNVVVTPHMAGASREAFLRGAAFAYENIQRVMAGQPPESVVTPDY